MAEYIEVKESLNRMCDAIQNCSSCPISSENNGKDLTCTTYQRKFPEKAERKITEWAKEHPIKTILEEFEENYPDAPISMHGIHTCICPRYIGYEDYHHICGATSRECLSCWSRPAKNKNK